MRKTYLLLLVAPAAFVWACGGSDDNIVVDGGPDATQGDSANGDTGTNDGTANDGTATDGGSDDVVAQDVSVNITCLKPADCIDGGDPDAAYPPDSGEVCCGTIATSGKFPNCSFNAANTACKAPNTCPTTVSLNSCTTDTVRLCESDTECTEKGSAVTTYNKCCSTNYQDAGRVHFCLNTLIAGQTTSITCP